MGMRWLLALMFCCGSLWAADDLFHLPIGDPARKEKTASVQLDAVTDTASGERLTPTELARRLRDVRIVLVGESHTAMEYHRAQLQLIQALHEAGREVLIGLEMFPATSQKRLDHWSRGLVTEKGFIELSDWYAAWGFNWNYYREIFLFARDRGLPMFAVNAPRAVVSAVRKKGFDNLSDDEKKHLPDKIDTDSDDHRRLFEHFLGGGEESFHSTLSEEQLDGLFNAQCTWDASMAYNTVNHLRERGGEESIMVVLAGFGHVAYGLGIQRQARRWFDGPMATVIPVSVVDEEGQKLESVQASFADYVWGLPHEEFPAFPELGVSTRRSEESGEISVIFVQSGSAGARAGVQSDDVLLEMDGVALSKRSVLNQLISEKRWGDSASLRVRRGEDEMTLEVQFRRSLQQEEPESHPQH